MNDHQIHTELRTGVTPARLVELLGLKLRGQAIACAVLKDNRLLAVDPETSAGPCEYTQILDTMDGVDAIRLVAGGIAHYAQRLTDSPETILVAVLNRRDVPPQAAITQLARVAERANLNE